MGRPTTRPKAASCWNAWAAGREHASGDGPHLRGRQDPRHRGDLGHDAGRAAEGEPENRTVLRLQTLQASERGRAAVPKTQELPTHPHAVRQARRNLSERREFRRRRRIDMRFSINRPKFEQSHPRSGRFGDSRGTAGFHFYNCGQDSRHSERASPAPAHRTSWTPRCCVIKQFLLPGSWGAALAARKPEPQGPGPKFADRLSVHTSPSESAIDNLEHCVLIRIRRRGSDGFELAIGLSVLALNSVWQKTATH